MRIQTELEGLVNDRYFANVVAICFYLLWGYFDIKCISSRVLLYIDN